MMHLERELNPRQLEAVRATEGPVLILAGAGSGKTRVITHRIAHLIENQNVRPESILAVTFTNKAAQQMKERVNALLRTMRTGNPLIATFHSFCVRVLRRYISAIGYGNDFTIYDDADQLSLVKSCLKELSLDEKVLQPRAALSRISHAKNHGVDPARAYQQAYDAKSERIAVVHEMYEKKLRQANALDFDDLLLKTVLLLGQHESIRRTLNEQYRYLMVDEYQDTNRAQYRLIRQLTERQQNLCVVGDEDQSIYGWRGADIQNILSFEKDYPNARIIKLEQNYRSTKNILDASGSLVSKNEARKGKTLWTERSGGDPVTLYEAPDAEAEALFVAHQILEYQRRHPSDSAAVLYRTNFQSRLFEEACRRSGIKYSVVGGFSFYERAEIKDLLSYLKLCLNPNDSVSLLRVINTPPRGIGKTSLDSLELEARPLGLSLWQALKRVIEAKSLPARALKAFADFQSLMQAFIEQSSQRPLPELVRTMIEKSGYAEWLQDEGTEEALTRLDNLKELVNAALDSESRGETLSDFLDHAALVSDTDDFNERSRVTLMSLHSAKGLEFPLVFVVGLEEGLFPHSRSLDTQQEIEEERRICYVGMTRAEKKLFLTRALFRRFLFGDSTNETERSRFLADIPATLIDDISPGLMSRRAAAYDGPTYNSRESIQQFYAQRGKQVDLAPVKKSQPGESNRFKQGIYVRHPKFGVGHIVRCEGEGDESKLTINFPGYGMKKMVQKFAGLEKV
ncbi:MAG: UvrD-helicase domain-containing protein [Acidobacteria bacterium]|nr:UvrD-helicase domain-containing protein [Acidobacteriota bacterium]MCI0724829.1 UvrD-helicase domain-containing protein [Acidobacteriota bacterium]